MCKYEWNWFGIINFWRLPLQAADVAIKDVGSDGVILPPTKTKEVEVNLGQV